VAIAACLLCWSLAQAKGPGKPGGGGETTGRFVSVRLPDEAGDTDRNSVANGMIELRDHADELVGLEVVGYVDDQAYYWAVDSTGAVLGAFALPFPEDAAPEAFTVAEDINANGTIVGSGGVWPDLRPLVWSDAFAIPVALSVGSAAFQGVAHDVNSHGLIVGRLDIDENTNAIGVWGIQAGGESVGPVILGTGVVGTPAVNDADQVVATVNLQACRWQVDWNGTTLTVSQPDLLTAEVVGSNGTSQTIFLPRVTGINEHGDVCGQYRPDGGALQGYLLTAEGELIDVPDLVENRRYGTGEPAVSDLNDAAEVHSIQVVGKAHVYQKNVGVIVEPETPVIWQGSRVTELQNITDQPDPPLLLEEFSVVSNAGWLAGVGWNADHKPRAIVLMPK